MKLNYILYIPAKAALDETLIRELSLGLHRSQKKAIILHHSIGQSINQTWFQTKKISAQLSERMILNLPMCAKDLGLFKMEPNLTLNKEKMDSHFQKINFIVLNPVILQNEQETILPPEEIIKEIRNQYGDIPLLTFSSNPLSPLGQTPFLLENNESYTKLSSAYPEETNQINWLFTHKPGYFISPKSISQI